MTILSENSNCTEPTVLTWVCAAIIVISVMVIIIALWESADITFRIGASLFIIAAFFGAATFSKVTHYKVIFDNSYTAKELLSKYDIVDVDGEIYIIKEREKEVKE